jgi:nitrogenase iron protein NifH
MRKAHGSKVTIILSEEMMANFAANNIARACKRYADNGICLAGLVVNLRSNEADLAPIQRFADAIGTRILQVVPRDPLVGEAELYRKSILEYAPDSPVAVAIRELGETLWNLTADECPVPEPLENEKVREVMRGPMRPDIAARLSA